MANRQTNPVQETCGIRYASSREIIPTDGRLEILQAFRQETVHVLNTGESVYVTKLSFEVAVKVEDRDERWGVTLKPLHDYLYISHRGEYFRGYFRVVLKLTPNGNTSTSASKIGSHGRELPPEVGCFKARLTSRYPTGFLVTFYLYYYEKNSALRLGFAEPRLLHSTEVVVRVPAPLVECPLPRRQLIGILSRPLGRGLIQHFQALVHNGEYEKFKADERRLFDRIDGKVEFTDLKCVVLFEESCAAYGKRLIEDVKRLAREASRLSSQSNSTNDRMIQALLKMSMASAYRAESKFNDAREELNIAFELLENVVPGEETALYLYLVAAMLADKSTHTELTVEEKQEAETAFVESMRHWNNQHHNPTNRIPMWSSIRELCYRLKAQPQKAPRDDLVLNQLELERAVELADVAEAQVLPTCPAAPKAILLLVISDCWKHQRDHEKAINMATQALNIAETFDLKMQINGAEERLVQLRQSFVQAVVRRGSRVASSVDDVSENPPASDDGFEGRLAELSRNALGNRPPIRCTMHD